MKKREKIENLIHQKVRGDKIFDQTIKYEIFYNSIQHHQDLFVHFNLSLQLI